MLDNLDDRPLARQARQAGTDLTYTFPDRNKEATKLAFDGLASAYPPPKIPRLQ
ncbi:MAG TPA: hypothetical protein VMF62_14950 [Acetobacteraceae bacterium]|jgi:hypothetical protein|nr:hypothetical protein [Acetobacteraceae bacterium]